ncbi:MAG: hypothetical protein WC708_17170 [Lentisphaeria bacterium]
MVTAAMLQSSIPRVAILGLGSAGGHIVAELASDELLAGAELAVADTDPATLQSLAAAVPLQIPLGDWTHQESCGGNAFRGEKAAANVSDDLRQFFAGASMAIVACGLGKGTGAGAARVVARLTRELDITTLFVVTLPFTHEGNWRCHQAKRDLELLRTLTDAVMAIPNDLLFTTLPADTPANRGFEVVNSILAEAISGLTRLPSATGILPVDFADLRGLLKERPGYCHLGVGRGRGGERWKAALEEFMRSPMIGGPETLAKADAAIITLVGAADLTVGEMQNCMTALQPYFPAHAKLFVGTYTDARCQDEVFLTGVLCRFQGADGSPLPAETAAAKPASGKPAAPKAPAGTAVQAELPLHEPVLGYFSGSAPTIHNGVNLDLPTCHRQGLALDLGGT